MYSSFINGAKFNFASLMFVCGFSVFVCFNGFYIWRESTLGTGSKLQLFGYWPTLAFSARTANEMQVNLFKVMEMLTFA